MTVAMEPLPDVDKAALQHISDTAANTLDEDIKAVSAGVDLFLNSGFKEAEALIRSKYGRNLYYTHAYSLIVLLKGLMTFDPKDIEIALTTLGASVKIASHLRKDRSLLSAASSFAGIGLEKEAARIGALSRLEKHAELVYAEAFILKGLLAIVTDPTMGGFIKEGINIKISYGIFQAASRYIETLVDQHHERDMHKVFSEAGVDEHWVTGVMNGIGVFELIFSLMPARVLKVFEFIGFSGERETAMSKLEIGGGWPINARPNAAKSLRKQVIFEVPSVVGPKNGGLRRFFCDILLLSYHCILPSLLPVADIDPLFSQKVIDYDLQKYPNSFLFLLLSAYNERINGRPEVAARLLVEVQQHSTEWKQLLDITYWELGINKLCLLEFNAAAGHYADLFKDNKWSKATNRYNQAACLYQADPVKNQHAVRAMMKEVVVLKKKLAGPFEKFFARKAQKFEMQGGRLLLPGYEAMYIYNAFDFMPEAKMMLALEDISKELSLLDNMLPPTADPDKVPYPTYYDDLCLARFLKGVVLRELALPTAATLVSVAAEAKLKPKGAARVAFLKEAARQFEFVKLLSSKISLDHWILPFARFEFGRLFMRIGSYKAAQVEYKAALNGGAGEGDDVDKVARNYSLETLLHMKTHNAIAKLDILQSL
ncbi:hypothetical protein SeLEV6574_g02629 [Synchytrium endobioticum]|nr:hypothetical protein SeLEV6574_g02629 [Synchytrium endobioticum]